MTESQWFNGSVVSLMYFMKWVEYSLQYDWINCMVKKFLFVFDCKCCIDSWHLLWPWWNSWPSLLRCCRSQTWLTVTLKEPEKIRAKVLNTRVNVNYSFSLRLWKQLLWTMYNNSIITVCSPAAVKLAFISELSKCSYCTNANRSVTSRMLKRGWLETRVEEGPDWGHHGHVSHPQLDHHVGGPCCLGGRKTKYLLVHENMISVLELCKI